jgi:hypothetical protein
VRVGKEGASVQRARAACRPRFHRPPHESDPRRSSQVVLAACEMSIGSTPFSEDAQHSHFAWLRSGAASRVQRRSSSCGSPAGRSSGSCQSESMRARELLLIKARVFTGGRSGRSGSRGCEEGGEQESIGQLPSKGTARRARRVRVGTHTNCHSRGWSPADSLWAASAAFSSF